MTIENQRGPATLPLPASRPTQTHSPSSTPQQLLPAAAESLSHIGPALQRLSAMKNHVNLTPYAIETWAAVLGQFAPGIVNEAVLRIGLSDDPFPDLGKLVMRCDAIRRDRQGIVSTHDRPQLSSSTLAKAAAALGLDIGAKP